MNVPIRRANDFGSLLRLNDERDANILASELKGKCMDGTP